MIRCFGLIVVMFCEAPQQDARAVTVCPVIQQRSAAFQREAAGEFARLPKGSALRSVTAEWINLRDQARKCRAGQR